MFCLAPLLIGGYLLYMNTLPFGFKKTYVLDIGVKADNNQSNKFYIDTTVGEERVGKAEKEKETTFRPIYKTPAYFILKPEIKTENIDAVKVKIRAKTSQSFQLGVTFNKQYHKKTFFLSSLKDRNSLQLADDIYLFSNGQIDNAWQGRQLSEVFKDLFFEKKIIGIRENIDFDHQVFSNNVLTSSSGLAKTSIPYPLIGGNYEFYTVLNDSLEFNIKKQDINKKAGSDELEVAVVDLKGNVLTSGKIPDEKQNLSFKKDNIPQGVYLIKVKGSSDSVISHLEINSEFLVVKGEVYPFDSGALFTKNTFDQEVNLYNHYPEPYTEPYVNRIKAGGKEEREIKTNEKMTLDLLDNELTRIDFVKEGPGMLHFWANSFFSFTPDSYFEPFKTYFTKSIDDKNDYSLITDYQPPVLDKDGFWLIEQSFPIDQLFHQKDNRLTFVLMADNLEEPLVLDKIEISLETSEVGEKN